MLGIALAVMLMLVGVTLFGMSIGLSAKSGAQVASSESAEVAVNHIGEDTREAYTFALPDDSTGFTPPSTYSAGQFETTFSGSNIDTGIELEYGNTMSVSVLNSTGATTLLSTQPTDQTASNNLWIYRADYGGVPDASSGQYLWLYGKEYGHSVNRPLCRLFDTAAAATAMPNAVTFSRPLDNGSPQAVIPYDVQISVTSGFYSPVSGTQTSVNGGTQHVSLCVLLRNHG
jgi:hypothetical protein